MYKDVEKQAQLMEITLGIPKFAILVGTNPIIYHGEKLEYTMKIAISRWLNTQIELIQPLKGQNIHTEFIKKRKDGLHHTNAIVEELEPYIEAFRNRGFQVLQSGQIRKQKFLYFDTKKAFGLIMEIQMIQKRRKL